MSAAKKVTAVSKTPNILCEEGAAALEYWDLRGSSRWTLSLACWLRRLRGVRTRAREQDDGGGEEGEAG
eukprot:6209295-Pleurochrysis_carterae.AAC.3